MRWLGGLLDAFGWGSGHQEDQAMKRNLGFSTPGKKEGLEIMFIIDELIISTWRRGFPGGSDGKSSACNVGDLGLIPGSGKSPGEGNGNPLQYSCLEGSMDGGACLAIVHGIAKSQTRLSNFTSHEEGSIMFDPNGCCNKVAQLGGLTQQNVFSQLWRLAIWN